eukprot:scaffold26321_cov30-Prasinocladus_malaysianus.AAC.3
MLPSRNGVENGLPSRVHGVEDYLEVQVRGQLLQVEATDELPREGHQPLEVVHVRHRGVKPAHRQDQEEPPGELIDILPRAGGPFYETILHLNRPLHLESFTSILHLTVPNKEDKASCQSSLLLVSLAQDVPTAICYLACGKRQLFLLISLEANFLSTDTHQTRQNILSSDNLASCT